MKQSTLLGAARLTDDPLELGAEMRKRLGSDLWFQSASNWEGSVGKLRASIENVGVMAIVNGVVGNNTRTKLDPREFLGFSLHDEYAPLIFVNGATAKASQVFTLAYEFAHLWLGESAQGLPGYDDLQPGSNEVEKFCDIAAANFLVPSDELISEWSKENSLEYQCRTLASKFKVSAIVISRRSKDLGLI